MVPAPCGAALRPTGATDPVRPRCPGRARPKTGQERRDPPTALKVEPGDPPRPVPLSANKQHGGRGQRMGGKGFSPSIGSAGCPSARPRLPRAVRLFLFGRRPRHSAAPPTGSGPPATPPRSPALTPACRVQRKNSR